METGAAIIIVTFNSETTIRDCLTSVTETLRPCDEVLVIDNNSQDNTVKLVRQFLKPRSGKIKFFPQTKNLGFSKGCNIGINHSAREYVILLNPDTEVFPNWAERLTDHFKFYDRTGAVGALSNRTLSPQNITTYVPDYMDYVENGHDLIAKLETDYFRKSIPEKVLMGFCLALRRDLIEKYGALDEDIFLGDDDLEISWRLRERGYFLRIALDVFVNHERQVSFATLPKKEAAEIVRDGSDVLFRKMTDFYKPNKIPNPFIYFGIKWWNPRILEEKRFEDIFCMNPLPFEKSQILASIKVLVKERKLDQAIEIINESLHILVSDYLMWFTLGSIYLMKEDFQNAEFALKNAWAFERDDNGRAGKKLKGLFESTKNSTIELEDVDQ